MKTRKKTVCVGFQSVCNCVYCGFILLRSIGCFTVNIKCATSIFFVVCKIYDCFAISYNFIWFPISCHFEFVFMLLSYEKYFNLVLWVLFIQISCYFVLDDLKLFWKQSYENYWFFFCVILLKWKENNIACENLLKLWKVFSHSFTPL